MKIHYKWYVYLKRRSQKKYITSAELGDLFLKGLYTTDPVEPYYR
jgi:hypothetical protein